MSTAITAGTTGDAQSVGRPRQRGSDVLRAIRGNKKALVGVVLLLVFTVLAVVPQWFTSVQDPEAHQFGLMLAPSAAHPLGTTAFGQDILAQLIYGTRQSMVIAIVVGGLATMLSVLVGVSAAYLGGVTDGVLSSLTDIFLVIPTFPLIIVIAAYAGKGNLTVMILVLVVTGWSYGARQLRAQALSLRNRDFLESARVRGERPSYIIVVEVLPTMTSLILANFLGVALYAVLTAAGLQFIGLGDNNAQSWGAMLHWAQSYSALQTGQPLWVIAPGLCVAALGASFALLNYAFDEISNPALRPVRRTRAKRADS
ncbi:MAG: peptide/nickel transport system permease protein [Nocardioidaceae bacterium]|nr:peptide/nickel transport system permease protein [Nocardioidaceae bacterium]